jgi:hypothetical protein
MLHIVNLKKDILVNPDTLQKLFLAQGFLDKFVVDFHGNELVKYAIVAFSIIAFGLIFIMVRRRFADLRGNAFTTFELLIGREAMKIEGTNQEREFFDRSLQDIE